MDILISFAAKVAEYTVAPIGRQVGYLIFYNDNFKELTERVKELEGARDGVMHRVREEERNGKRIETSVQNWLDSVDGVIAEANQLQKDPRRTKAGCSGWSFPNLVLRHQLSRKALKMSTTVVVREKGKSELEPFAYLPALEGVASTSSASRNSENLESRKPIMKDIMHALGDHKLSKIGVYGFGGVGKTTLVKEVAKIAKQEKLVDNVVLANVSKTPDIRKIQGEIADQLGLKFIEETNTGRAFRLCQRIKSERNILIILDDIWERFDLEKVGIPSEGEHNSCKLLMTSRNSDILKQMEVKKDFRLEVLNEEEAWKLFKDKAGDIDKEPSLQQIASQVAKKCAGLPVLIVTVARSLVHQDIHAWRDALTRLKRFDNKEMEDITYSALELSYNRLQGNAMKTLFLLCATEGSERPLISDLFKYGMGLGIFNNPNTIEGARNRLYKMISALKASCLLLEDDTSECVKMHDIVREVGISIASRDQHMLVKSGGELNEWPTMSFLRSCTQIILYDCQIPKLPEKLSCPNLKVFNLSSVDRSLEIPNSLFEGTESLTVLDFTNMNFASLPTSFRFLTNLQTLCLDYCVLENMDAIGDLKSLQILSLIGSSMIKLPDKIGKLTQLRMLDLSGSGIGVLPPNIISSLIRLEELCMANSSIKWEVDNSATPKENASLDELQQLSNLTALELQIREAWMIPRDLMFEKLERYKIFIGDIWELPYIEDETLKTLKLKLGTNIHLEHGIKSLIKGVENLYLDEVEGISNVLYQLNGEGFLLLKHLHIQNHAKIKHIIDSVSRNHPQVCFPKLETLVIQNLNDLEKICHGSLAVNSFAKLRVIKVEKCIQLKYLLPLSMVKGLSLLSEVEVSQCNFMEKVVFGDSNESADNDRTFDKIEFLSLHSLTLQHLQTLDSFFSYELTSSGSRYQRSVTPIPVPFFNSQVVFPNLDTLKLSSLNLSKIWEDNQHSAHNLTKLIVESCHGLKYLFSSTMVGSFPNLMRLEISDCHMMEEIIATEERNNNIVGSRQVRFSSLETIILKDMKNLKTIWYKEFDMLKMLQVKNCEKIVVVFPSSMQQAYHNLETLVVTDCTLVEEIFEFSSNEKCNAEDPTTQLKSITLQGLPKLKQTWISDPQGILSFQNLEDVCLEECAILEYLFPFSVAISCSHLKELSIKYCWHMKEIVAQKEGSMCTNAIFEFNQLNTLLLWQLDKLKGFYAGNHTFMCPSLRKIDVRQCEKLNLFRTLSTSNQERFQDGKLHESGQQSSLIVEEVVPNLEELTIDEKNATTMLQAQNISALFTKIWFLGLSGFENEGSAFPNWFFQNVDTMKDLVIEWAPFKKIFQEERLVNEKICGQLERLTLHQLPELQHICEEGFQIDPVLGVLKYLDVDGCSSLPNLVPSSVSFSHLTKLKIHNCNGMTHLISPPTARSLAKLEEMKVKECSSLEEIMDDEGDETIYDGISFLNLEILKLECLPRLKRFSSSKCFLRFPLLEEVVVIQCPRIKNVSEGVVSTPKLRNVVTSKDNKERRWKGDLNGTIKNMFDDKVAFLSFKDLKLSKYPELNELWYGQLEHKIFSNLKNLVVHKCDFLSDVLFQLNLLDVLVNLEELDVRDCNSLEAVFDVKGLIAEEILVKKCTLLKTLTLSRLSKLKHVWKEDRCATLSFQNLREVSITHCQSLKSLFPLSIARDIAQLQSLKVSDCAIKEIVVNERGTEDMIEFVFPNLSKIQLLNLRALEAFFTGIHCLRCKSLKDLNVFNCQKLVQFKTMNMNCQQRAKDGKIRASMHQPLFTIEEVLPNMENLTVNNEDVEIILQSKYSRERLTQLKSISVCKFENEDTTFPYWLLENACNLEALNVEWSSFREIFQYAKLAGDEGQVKISTLLKNLNLYQLHDLHHICEEGLLIDPVLQHLEWLTVNQCSSLINLVPSTVTFAYLTYLEVENCNGLINLIACSTAKSLVNLTTMKIKYCSLLEDVVNGKEDESNNEIAFCNLQTLKLVSLPSLRRFCSCKCFIQFPMLKKVVVKECPRMEIFTLGDTSTPNLQKVEIEENSKEYRWESNLNETIKNMFKDKVAFYRFKDLTLSEYPELKDFWYGQHHHNMFGNLKSLVVQKCDFLTDVLLPSNILKVLHGLEALDVRECSSLESLFDVKGVKSEGMPVKQTCQLKRLTLYSLPKLKHIWNTDPHGIIGFGFLCEVDVIECQSLVNLFSLSQCQDLDHLEMLNVESSGVLEEIVALEEGSIENRFSFPHLWCLRLMRLTKLKGFYLGRHTLECPSLKILNVYRCEALQMFAFNHSDLQQPHQVEETRDMCIPQSLFSIEKVSPNLEQLALNDKDAIMIFSGNCEEIIFPKLKVLCVQCFYETQITFWNDFLEKFPNLVTFEVRNSSFETLFPAEEVVHCKTKTAQQVRGLCLSELEHLMHIWHKESPLDHRLAPQNLTYLWIDNCKGLTYVITSSIAKSLMQLKTLIVESCPMIEDIVKIDEEEAEETFLFENLEYLKFSYLSSLRSFCYGKPTLVFPSLVEFIVKGCPQMKIFSPGAIIAPFLTTVVVENERKRWKDDINTTIEQLFKDKQEVSHSNEN